MGRRRPVARRVNSSRQGSRRAGLESMQLSSCSTTRRHAILVVTTAFTCSLGRHTMTPEDADHSRSPTASSSQLPSAHDHQAPPSKRSKHSPAAATRPNDGASTSTLTSTPPWAPTPTPQQLSSGRYTKLKPGEELLPQEEQDKILRRRLRDAERKRRDREKAQIAKNAAAAGTITGSAMQSDAEHSASIKGTSSSSTPSTPAASGALQAFAAAVIAEGRPAPSAPSQTPAEMPRPSSSSSSSDEVKAQAAAEKKAKAAADKKAAAERRAAAAAEKLAAERAALLAAEQEMQEEEEEDDDENEDDADQKLYCICRTLYGEAAEAEGSCSIRLTGLPPSLDRRGTAHDCVGKIALLDTANKADFLALPFSPLDHQLRPLR